MLNNLKRFFVCFTFYLMSIESATTLDESLLLDSRNRADDFNFNRHLFCLPYSELNFAENIKRMLIVNERENIFVELSSNSTLKYQKGNSSLEVDQLSEEVVMTSHASSIFGFNDSLLHNFVRINVKNICLKSSPSILYINESKQLNTMNISFICNLNFVNEKPKSHWPAYFRMKDFNFTSSLIQVYEWLNLASGICQQNPIPTEPRVLKAYYNASEHTDVNITDNIGIDAGNLKVNLTQLEVTLSNDTAIDNILSAVNDSSQNFNSEDQTVEIKAGVHIEALANFQSDTMDYEMDVYLRMAWRDPRLIHQFKQPILVKENDILEKIWRPDPYFSNSREASLHEVPSLNAVLLVFPEGEVLSEVRVNLQPSCNLLLCKFPHDKQKCSLYIRSFAYPESMLKFVWFSNADDAVRRNPKISLPELYIVDHFAQECDGSRLTGNFTCLKVSFSLKRAIGLHLAQTYVPTAFALMFSWIAAWIPSELMEARIGVALTVLLTLSADAGSSSENMPNVSYTKALDVWFHFINISVLLTLIQSMIILQLDMKQDDLLAKGQKNEKRQDYYISLAARYHRVRVVIDELSRLLFPVSFVAFLFYYCFILIEGEQNSCITRHTF